MISQECCAIIPCVVKLKINGTIVVFEFNFVECVKTVSSNDGEYVIHAVCELQLLRKLIVEVFIWIGSLYSFVNPETVIQSERKRYRQTLLLVKVILQLILKHHYRWY